jgi:hypothetical protein
MDDPRLSQRAATMGRHAYGRGSRRIVFFVVVVRRVSLIQCNVRNRPRPAGRDRPLAGARNPLWRLIDPLLRFPDNTLQIIEGRRIRFVFKHEHAIHYVDTLCVSV